MADPREIKEFYAHGRFWKFYGDGTNMVYRTSTDGQNWNSPEPVSACPTELSKVIEWKDGKWHLKEVE